MFELNGIYANRKGNYTIIALNPPKMTVRYEDGTTADLNIEIQERIWENIVAEQEAKASRSLKNRLSNKNTQFFIKAISVPTDEILFPGWQERVAMVKSPEDAQVIKSGDRVIYYAVEAQVFFAVVTITGDAFRANPKDYFFNLDIKEVTFFPVDTDASAISLETGVPYDSMDLESQPNFRKLRLKPETFLRINEDDFELLAELLTEITELDDDIEEEEEEYTEEEL